MKLQGATNIFDPVVLEKTFFPESLTAFRTINNKIPIFYCEYSTARGPLLASHLRKSDRVRNYHRYPFVHYQEIYVLEGGYNAFYNVENAPFRDLCEPDGYTQMRDKKHKDEFEKYRIHNVRSGIGFETGMFQTALIRKDAGYRRTKSTPLFPESPSVSATALVKSLEKFRPDNTISPMLANPRTPTGLRRNDHCLNI
ncbi:unnamed protein product [Gongylonema pulchrum]|uniref:protein-tyrosine-phosphatase n=1 Tax=Gongylonema pulchrum TaxID=637853 RepID=A0A183DN19_9BILA|nr:unnamed protein product [Gongylonema pulchrum]